MRPFILGILTWFVVFLTGCNLDTSAPTPSRSIERTAQVGEKLTSVPATNLYSITQMYLAGTPGGWSQNGVTFCDLVGNDRCVNEPTPSLNYHSHGLVRFNMSGVDCPVLVKANLVLSTRTWDGLPKTLEVRRVLVDWTAPAEPCSVNGVMSSSTVGWKYAKAGVAWNTPGAWGIGTDISSDNVIHPVADGLLGQSIDVTSLAAAWFDGSAPNHGLWLASTDDANLASGKHIGVVQGTWALALECTMAVDPTSSSSTTTSGTGGATSTSTTTSTSGVGGAGGSGGTSTTTTSTSTTSTTTSTSTGDPDAGCL